MVWERITCVYVQRKVHSPISLISIATDISLTIDCTNYVCLGYELHIRIIGEDPLK